ncbi:hypothetical protein B0H63DRAFT_445496 [Podospora didyma]|uniref:Up-regulated in Daf-2 domain-containing protein n=1 Tax=Podospora didyma TaxID=330526 RepID=A0AAE0NX47_9PEZI|nr:hypothetical protein B0H63DRAFT_445496 [Podospora didyma]
MEATIDVQGVPHTAQINFVNDFPVKLRSVILVHRYGSEKEERKRWDDALPNTTTASTLEVNYKTGFGTASDYWNLEFQFEDGIVFYVANHQQDLRVSDDNQVMSASISGYTFYRTLKSIRLFHHYSDYPDVQKNFGSIDPGKSSSFWPVHYLSGFGQTDTDHWKVGVILKVDPPSNKMDKKKFSVNGAGFNMENTNLDKWKTPLGGHNSLAFIRLKNDYKYSSDDTYQYEFGNISVGAESVELEMVEYLTGMSHPGMDWWTLEIYLKDGTWYQSSKIERISTLRSTQTRPYSENCFIASHNSFANNEEGYYLIPNQAHSIRQQLTSASPP